MGNARTAASTFIAIALLAGCTAVRPPRVDANEKRSLKSLAGTYKAQIAFVNDSGQPVKVFWIDFDGHRKLYKTLEKGESYDQQTFLNHPWLITDVGDNAWYIFFADAQPRSVSIVAPAAGTGSTVQR